MAEYAGYVSAPNQFDFGKFSSELASNKIAIEENVRAEREKKKAAFQKSTADIYADIKEPEKSYNETDNDFFTKATIDARDFVVGTTKETDYNITNTAALTMKQTNAKNTIAGLGEVAKVIKANQEKLIDPKFQEGQSDIGRNFSRLFVTTSNSSNKRMIFEKDGSGYIREVDASGKPISSVKINPITLKSTQGWSDSKIDYEKQLNDFTANQVGEFQTATRLRNGAIATNESIENNPLFKDAKAKLVTSITANDIESSRFLTSSAGYASYIESDLQQKEKLLNQGIPEEKLIPIGLGADGLPTAKLTPAQRKAAVDEVNLKIQQRVEVTETLTKPITPRSGGGGADTKPTEAAKARRAAINESIALREKAGKNPYDGYVFTKIKNALKSEGPIKIVPLIDEKTGTKLIGYDIFKIKEGKIQILDKDSAGSPKGAFLRMSAGAQGFFELLNKNQKRGDEFISWGNALDEYESSGGDMSRVAPEIEISAPGYGKKTTKPNIKIVTMAMIKQKLGKNATQSQINAYIKQLESNGNFKVQTK